MSGAGVGIPLIVMGSVVAWISLYFWREGRDLRAAGVEARAAIVRKFRKPGSSSFLSSIENCFVEADFVDAAGTRRLVEIRVPSRQFFNLRAGATETIVYLPSNPQRARVLSVPGQTVLASIMIFTMAMGGLMALGGLFFLATGFSERPATAKREPAPAAEPPPTRFDKSGAARVWMTVSPQHDRIALIEENGSSLRIREIASGRILASANGNGWRMLGWRPDGARIAVAEGGTALVLDAQSLQIAAGETYSWNPEAPALAGCRNNEPVWDTARKQAAVPCGNDVMVVGPDAVRLLQGHRDRVLGVAWSPGGALLASVSEDNYVRVWNPESQRCVAVSEDYPYPRAIYFLGEETIVVIDAAMRQYTMQVVK